MDANCTFIVVVDATGAIIQTGRSMSLEASAAWPKPDGATVLGFADDPGVDAAEQRWDSTSQAFVALPPVVPPPPPVPTLDELKAAKGAAAVAAFNTRIAAGLLVDGLHVQIDAESRGNLIGLVTMAGLVRDGITTWPENYSRGWVTAEGPRIPLPTPADGIQLALAASSYYADLVQFGQDLANSIAAAADDTALGAIDPTAGWPTS